MAKRLRRGKLTVGTDYSGVVNMSWDDATEFDRKQADNEYSGTPIEIKRGGSGEVRFVEGTMPPAGYQTNDWVFTYYEVTLTNGVESVVEKTQTFTGVTCVHGGNIPSEGIGELSAKFDYSTRTGA